MTEMSSLSDDRVTRRRRQLRDSQRLHRKRKETQLADQDARIKELEFQVADLKLELQTLSSKECHTESHLMLNQAAEGNTRSYPLAMPLASNTTISTSSNQLTLGLEFTNSFMPLFLPIAPNTDIHKTSCIYPPLPKSLFIQNSIPISHSLQYHTVQRTLSHTLNANFASLDRIFQFHLSDPTTMSIFTHPSLLEVTTLLSAAFTKGYFSPQWSKWDITSATHVLMHQQSYMQPHEVEGFVNSYVGIYETGRWEWFVEELAGRAVCFGWLGPAFGVVDVWDIARRAVES